MSKRTLPYAWFSCSIDPGATPGARLTWEHARADARAEGRADSLLTVLRARGIAVPAAVRRRILAQRNQRQLDRWLAKASVASSIEEVIGNRG
jgi:hypothetical protein